MDQVRILWTAAKGKAYGGQKSSILEAKANKSWTGSGPITR